MPYELKNASILIVDDMQPMLSLVASLLKIFGFRNILQARDAEEGFTKFIHNNPDIVITDWLMGPYDGIELIHKIRTDPQSPNKFVPVIMMTGYSHKIRVEGARDTGVTEFLVKPFRAKDLYTRVEQLIEKPRRFVETGEFFGPDRRRRKMTGYEGPLRRDQDEFRKIAAMEDRDAATLLRELQKQAKETGRGKDRQDKDK